MVVTIVCVWLVVIVPGVCVSCCWCSCVVSVVI